MANEITDMKIVRGQLQEICARFPIDSALEGVNQCSWLHIPADRRSVATTYAGFSNYVTRLVGRAFFCGAGTTCLKGGVGVNFKLRWGRGEDHRHCSSPFRYTSVIFSVGGNYHERFFCNPFSNVDFLLHFFTKSEFSSNLGHN